MFARIFGSKDEEVSETTQAEDYTPQEESLPQELSKGKEPVEDNMALKFEDYTRESKSALSTVELFDGFRFELSKIIGESPPFQVSHGFSLGSMMEPSSYSFASHLKLQSWGLIGRADTDGRVMGKAYNIGESGGITVHAQATPEAENSGFGIESELKRKDWAGTFKWNFPGIFSLSYGQRMNEHLSLGSELLYHHQQGLSIFSFGGRYNTPSSVITCLASAAHVSTTYTRKLTPNINFTSELTAMWGSGNLDTAVSLGVEYQLRSSHLKFHVESTGKVTASVEEFLNQFTHFNVCADLDHMKKVYRFGFGVTMGV